MLLRQFGPEGSASLPTTQSQEPRLRAREICKWSTVRHRLGMPRRVRRRTGRCNSNHRRKWASTILSRQPRRLPKGRRRWWWRSRRDRRWRRRRRYRTATRTRACRPMTQGSVSMIQLPDCEGGRANLDVAQLCQSTVGNRQLRNLDDGSRHIRRRRRLAPVEGGSLPLRRHFLRLVCRRLIALRHGSLGHLDLLEDIPYSDTQASIAGTAVDIGRWKAKAGHAGLGPSY